MQSGRISFPDPFFLQSSSAHSAHPLHLLSLPYTAGPPVSAPPLLPRFLLLSSTLHQPAMEASRAPQMPLPFPPPALAKSCALNSLNPVTPIPPVSHHQSRAVSRERAKAAASSRTRSPSSFPLRPYKLEPQKPLFIPNSSPNSPLLSPYILPSSLSISLPKSKHYPR